MKRSSQEKMVLQPSSPAKLPVCGVSSHTIREAEETIKPKTRIVHVLAPEVIKTDAASFRELVQRLTGKHAVKKRKTTSTVSDPDPDPDRKDGGSDDGWMEEDEQGGGFRGKLVDLDLFVQGLIQCPKLPSNHGTRTQPD